MIGLYILAMATMFTHPDEIYSVLFFTAGVVSEVFLILMRRS